MYLCLRMHRLIGEYRIFIILLKCLPFMGKIRIFIPNSWIPWFFNLMHMWFIFTKVNKMPMHTNTTTKIDGFEEEWEWNDLSSYTNGGKEYDHIYVKVTHCWLWDGEWDLKWVPFLIPCSFEVYNFYSYLSIAFKMKKKREERREWHPFINSLGRRRHSAIV